MAAILLPLGLAIGTRLMAAPIVFTDAYKTVNDSQADQYLLSATGATKSSDHWAVSVDNIAGTITYKYSFSGKITSAAAHLELTSKGMMQTSGSQIFSAHGSSSAWASKDGVNWTLLLDNSIPSGGPIGSENYNSYKVYDQNLPDELIGGDTIYIQIRLLVETQNVHGWETYAEFSASSSAQTTDVYKFQASIEPSQSPPAVSPSPSGQMEELKLLYEDKIKKLNRQLLAARHRENAAGERKIIERIVLRIRLYQYLLSAL